MKELAQLLNEMQRAGVIGNYALFGATEQMRYTEPVATLDAAVLVAVADPDRGDPRRGRLRADGGAVRRGLRPAA